GNYSYLTKNHQVLGSNDIPTATPAISAGQTGDFRFARTRLLRKRERRSRSFHAQDDSRPVPAWRASRPEPMNLIPGHDNTGANDAAQLWAQPKDQTSAAISIQRVARLSRNVGQPDHILANPVKGFRFWCYFAMFRILRQLANRIRLRSGLQG